LRTALHIAAADGHLEAAIALVQVGGADPSAADRWGRCPIMEAERVGATRLAQFLKAAALGRSV
jgi:ankyrin repeat protein